jgi:hypothetical protein
MKQTTHPQEDKIKRESLRERFIKNKRPLNPTHISLKKDKHLEMITTEIIVLMSKSNDDEERKTL